MEIFKRFRKPEEFKIRVNELTNRHELNVQRAQEFMDRHIQDSGTEKLIREAEAIFMSGGETLADVAWIAGLRGEGLGDREILRIWTGKQNVSDMMRDIMHGDSYKGE